MARPELPTFDLVVATVGRTTELDRLLASLDRQTHRAFRVLLVDQNEDDRLASVLAAHPELDQLRLRSERGLSRARNRALPELRADVVAFPDDDCVYPPGLLRSVAERFVADPRLDGLTGRSADADGCSAPSWEREPAALTDANLWNRVNAGASFLRRELVGRVGVFDERLGLGSSEPWSSGEEVDYLIRAIREGARIAYDPTLVVVHDVRPDDVQTGLRDGASIGYLLRKHRYPRRMLGRMLVRPVGGIWLSLLRMDSQRARFHAATLRGRLRGLWSSRVSAA